MAAPTDRVRLIVAVAAMLSLTGCQDSLSRRDPVVAWGPTLLATVIAFFTGFAVIAWLLRWDDRHN
jgi:undecaprenyl-diphosphatase